MEKRRMLWKVVPTENKRKMQLKYVYLTLALLCASAVFLGITFNVSAYLVLTSSQLGRFAESRLDMVFYRMNLLFGLITFLVMAVGAILSLHLAHRFVGPLYRIETMLKDLIENNNQQTIRIREDDELHDLVLLLNEVIEKKIKQQS